LYFVVNEYFLVAEIKTIFNKNGFLSLISHSDEPERFLSLRKVYIEIFGDMKEFMVEKVVPVKNYFTIKFVNFNSDQDVDFFVGKRIYVDSENLVKLTEDTFFIHDLIDSRVFAEGKPAGILKDVIKLPSNDVYVIHDLSGKEFLVPAVKDYVESFDKINKTLNLKPGYNIFENDED